MSAPSPLYSVNEFSTPHNSFAEDVDQIARTGGDGIGIWEAKLGGAGNDPAALRLLDRSGLRASVCVPAVWSLFPNHLSAEPAEPEQRVEAICASFERLAPFKPASVVVTPGTAAELDRDQAMARVLDLLGPIVATAERVGTTIGLEPIRQSSGGIVHSLRQSLEIREAFGSERLGVVFDVWHLWDEPEVLGLLSENIEALAGVQLNDWREPTRGWTDRALPGEGVADVVGIVRTLVAAGYEGWYDLELFSDDGTYVERYPDSLWLQPHEELLATAQERFESVWSEATRG